MTKNKLYPNNLKNREFDKEASQNSHLERATIVRAQGTSEDENFEKKPTPSKTDSSGCLGIIDLDAEHYRDYSEQQYSRVHELLDLHSFEESANILDIGCGNGRITAEIATRVPKGKVTGIDASPNMIRLAQDAFPRLKYPNLEFNIVKAEEMVFHESFDKIVCFNCLLWIRNPKIALNLMCNFLKPGGELIILTYLKESSYVDFLEETLQSFSQYSKLSAVHTMLSENEYKQIIQDNNLKLNKFSVNNLVSYFNNKEELKNYIKGWLGSYVPLPNELHDQFLEQAIENSFTHTVRSENHSIGLPFKSLVIKAERKLQSCGC